LYSFPGVILFFFGNRFFYFQLCDFTIVFDVFHVSHYITELDTK
jgi:hypothetical protein